MEKNEESFLARVPEGVKVAIVRWWFAGAIYFMLGWGLLGELDSLDLMFFVGLGIGVAHIFVLHPLIYSMFNIKRNGKIVNKKYYERTILEGVAVKLGEILKCIVCSFVVGYIYVGINLLINLIFNLPSDTIKLGGEPILYGLFFMFIYVFLSLIAAKIVLLFEMIKNKKNKNENCKKEEGRSE